MNQATMTRKIVHIDEDKCNGCGQCVPSCAEGAIKIIDGKARLLADNLCDGLGNCLGMCPMDAITIEERPADAFDEEAVHEHLAQTPAQPASPASAGGCPGAAARVLNAASPAAASAGGCPGAAARALGASATPKPAPAADADRPSHLGHWPVQLALVPPAGPMWQDADVLIAADCVSVAMPDFHEKLLAGRSVAVACPKLDQLDPYIEKLTAIFAGNTIRSVTVAHMEVPCCMGIVYAVEKARERADRQDIPVRDVTVGVDGQIRGEQTW